MIINDERDVKETKNERAVQLEGRVNESEILDDHIYYFSFTTQ